MGRDTATGKRHYHTETVHGKKAQAEDPIREILTKLKTGETLKVSVDSFSSFIDEWMDSKRHSVSEVSFKEYEKAIKYYIRPQLGSKLLAQIDSDHIQKAYNKLKQGDLSRTTIRYVHKLLGMIFKLAVIRKKIQGSPMVGVELPKDWDEGEEDWKDFGFIFTSDKSDPFAQHQLRIDCNRILTKAGLPQSFNPYTARHTMASLLIEGGANVKAVSERLGHSRVGITLDTYTHVSEGMQREVSDDIERILSGDK